MYSAMSHTQLRSIISCYDNDSQTTFMMTFNVKITFFQDGDVVCINKGMMFGNFRGRKMCHTNLSTY